MTNLAITLTATAQIIDNFKWLPVYVIVVLAVMRVARTRTRGRG